MYGTREAQELVALWQELQGAQVEGSTRRLAAVKRRALGQAARDGASDEWRLVAEEAARDLERLSEAAESQPSIDVGDQTVTLDEEAAPEPANGGRRRALGFGQLIWLVILLAYVLVQVLSRAGDGP